MTPVFVALAAPLAGGPASRRLFSTPLASSSAYPKLLIEAQDAYHLPRRLLAGRLPAGAFDFLETGAADAL